MKNIESLQIKKSKEGKRIFIRRFSDKYFSIKQYREDIEKEVKQGIDYPHPHLMEYLGISNDEQGSYVEFKFVSSGPLSQAILDSGYGINNSKDSFKMANQLFDVVSFLNNHNIFHLNVTPQTIYITKNNHDVKLINPLNTYINNDLSFAIFDSLFSAPEIVTNDAIISNKCDIYSLGKILEYIFSYSNLTIPLKRVIKKATNIDPSKRYETVGEMKKAFNNIKLYNYSIITAQIIGIAALVSSLFLIAGRSNSNMENYRFFEESKIRHSIEQNQINEEHRISNTVINTLFMDSLKAQRDKMQAIAESIFRKEFTKRAEKIISNIYTTNRMNSSKDEFKKESLDGFTELDILQKKLAKDYNLDIALTTKLSSEIINELTTKTLNKLNTQKEQD